ASSLVKCLLRTAAKMVSHLSTVIIVLAMILFLGYDAVNNCWLVGEHCSDGNQCCSHQCYSSNDRFGPLGLCL
ncbi:hypothetical protein BOX15_Mlig014797g1, partial [Macrostomum lignano]